MNQAPHSASSAFPSFEQFPQGMDFLKQFWAQSAAPSPAQATATPAFQQAMGQYLLPTLDVDELDKRINDLRTVLQFMELNTNMLRQSLQALEVQRSTLAALHAMAQPASGAATNTASHPHSSPDSPPHPATPWLAAWQSMMQHVATPAASPSSPTAKPAKKAPPKQTAKQAKGAVKAAVKAKAKTKSPT